MCDDEFLKVSLYIFLTMGKKFSGAVQVKQISASMTHLIDPH